MAATRRTIQRREQYERILSKIGESKQYLEQACSRTREAIDEVARSRADHDETATQWSYVLEGLLLDVTLEPPSALAVVGQIRGLREQVVTVNSLRRRICDITDKLSEIEARLLPILEEADLPLFQPYQALYALQDIQKRFSSHRASLERRRSLEDQTQDWVSERTVTNSALGEVTKEMTDLLSAALCADENSFMELGEQVTKRQEMDSTLEALQRSHPLLVSADGQLLRNDWRSVSAEEAHVRLNELAEEIVQSEQELEQQLGDLRSLTDERKKTEISNSASEIQFNIGTLRERVESDAHRWAVLSIAKRLLEATRDDFQRDRQGPLLQVASQFFEQFTLGNYTRVQAVLGEERVQIVEPSERTREVTALSRGTAEQLYLAMRFALVDEYSRSSESMPVLLDDVMVDFDPDRSRAVCEAIIDVSSRHQVLVLTCHPATVAQLQSSAEDASAPQPHLIMI
ncbi:MAG TPA: hypothetical protein EYO94_11875 [Acidobacteria bacterium]|nr:hypothetical protein [Acidobacteriota bacterium]